MQAEKGTEFEINIGQISDVDTIARFQVAMALETEGMTLDLDRVTRGVTAAMHDESKGRYVVVRQSGEVIGSLMLTKEWSDWNCQWYWWIQSVYVTPQHRGRGVYKAMYSKVKAMASDENVSQIRLYVDKTNQRAQRVYEKLGMSETHYLMYEVAEL